MDWINAGGILIVQRSSIPWAIRNGLTTATLKKNETKSDSLARGSYVEAQDFYGSKETGGSYYETMLDITHPVGFGFTSPKLTVYRNSNVFLIRVKTGLAK